MLREGRRTAAQNMILRGIDALIICGGDGSRVLIGLGSLPDNEFESMRLRQPRKGLLLDLRLHRGGFGI